MKYVFMASAAACFCIAIIGFFIGKDPGNSLILAWIFVIMAELQIIKNRL